MKIGQLKHRITFQELIRVVNMNGFEELLWKDSKTVWASMTNLTGKEYIQAAVIQTEIPIKCIIRYTPNINHEMRIKFRDRFYDITSISEIMFESRFLEIKAIEVPSYDEN